MVASAVAPSSGISAAPIEAPIACECPPTVVPAWTVAPDPVAALHDSLQPGFDPARLAVVEHAPGITQSPRAQPGTATYQELRPEDVVVTVHATAPSIVVVRNNYDPGWSATVDGTPATVLATDEFRQGVAVGAGDHVVRLTFRDPSIGKGVRDSAIVWDCSRSASARRSCGSGAAVRSADASPATSSREERERVHRRHYDQERPVAHDERPVLEHSAHSSRPGGSPRRRPSPTRRP